MIDNPEKVKFQGNLCNHLKEKKKESQLASCAP